MSNRHPSEAELLAFANLELSENQSREIDSHLNECEICSQKVPDCLAPPIIEIPLLPPGYRMIEEVGRGGIGVVYRARRERDNVEVIIKTLLPKHRDNPVMSNYLRNEVYIAERIQTFRAQRGQIRTYSATDQSIYLEFPYIPGVTLAQKIREKQTDLPQMIDWLLQCCRAVEVGHQQTPPILHFDLKPENVLIYNSDAEAVLIDFGLACEWPPEPGTFRHGCGTPAYMAPELAKGEIEKLGKRTDVFAIGGMLCAILTGEPPYTSSDLQENTSVLEGARVADLQPAYQRLDACKRHPGLVAYAKKCLDPDPLKRPADAGEVRRDLQKLLGEISERSLNLRERLILSACISGCLLLFLMLMQPFATVPKKEEILTVGKWARFFKTKGYFLDQNEKIIYDDDGSGIGKYEIGAYPLITFHKPELIESLMISHDVRLSRPLFHLSDFNHRLDAVPRQAAIDIPNPDAYWVNRVDADRLCKHPLKISVALSNRQFVHALLAVGGGLAVKYEELHGPAKKIISGNRLAERGAGARAFSCCDAVKVMWNEANSVKLHVKLRNFSEPLEYDLHPSKLGWEELVRDEEAD
jgi:serine/threonine protein kinase